MGTFYKRHYTQQRVTKRRIIFLFLSVLYIIATFSIKSFSGLHHIPSSESSFSFQSRKILSLKNTTNTNNSDHKCTEPSIKEFPEDILTQKQRQYGGILLHVFLAFYMFVALAFVCDDYFISSLDKICERLNLSEDVAGATFMAAGSSAPELFTSIIGVFITKGDVGIGTIVGSAVFNILVIIALCGLFAGQVVHLTWWPLLRDSMYYILAIASLIWTIFDGYVTWYESTVMILLYIGYIIMMKFNPTIVSWINKRYARKEAVKQRERTNSGTNLMEDAANVKYMDGTKQSYDQIELSPRRRVTWKELGMMIMLTDKFSPSTRFRAACLIVILKGGNKEEGDLVDGVDEDNNEQVEQGTSDQSCKETIEDASDDIEGTPFLYPEGSIIRIIFWVLSLPLVTLLYFTIPDCRKAKWEAWYIVTFIASIFWIMVFSYLMVWMVCVIGYTIGVPDVIMGITFLAAGTSIPDAISSLLVAREGMGDMAVSNSIGSNIFDILLGLALPWFIKTVFMQREVEINSRGMVYSVGLLFASVLITVLMIHFNKWRLDKKIGFAFMLIYFIFITFSACIEFNLFGFVNYPSCPHNG